MSKKKTEIAAPDENDQVSGNASSDLESLRGILFGNQAKAVNRRLDDLESRGEESHLALTNLVNEKINSLASGSSQDLTVARKELVSRIDQNHKELTDKISDLATDFQSQLRVAQKELTEHLTQLNAEQIERARAVQVEARQQNDELRQELLTLTAWLDDKKTTRLDLGILLAEIGERLQNNDLPSKSDKE